MSGCYVFNGTTDQIVANFRPPLNNGTQILWVNLQEYGAGNCDGSQCYTQNKWFFGNYDPSSGYSSVGQIGVDEAQFVILRGNADTYRVGVANLNVWTQLAWSYNGSTWKFYINGQLTRTMEFEAPDFQPTQVIDMGQPGNLALNNAAQCKITHVRIYNRTLTDEQILRIYNSEDASSSSSSSSNIG